MAVFTTETRLEKRTCEQLMDYLTSYVWDYSIAQRYAWRQIVKKDGLTDTEKSKLNTKMQGKFNILKRTANSIIYDMKGRYKALKELKNLELSQLATKIEDLEEKAEKLKVKVDEASKKAAVNALDEKALARYRKDKKSLFYKNQKLRKLKDRYAKLDDDIKNKHYKMTFGGKKAFKAQYHPEENGLHDHGDWYLWFLGKRDANIFYLGSGDETAGNQMFTLTPSVLDKNSFRIRVRMDGRYAPAGRSKSEGNYLYGECTFHYMSEELRFAILSGKRPVSFRVKIRGSKVYLQAVINIPDSEKKTVTSMFYGAVGIDFNDGHIDLSETDEKGNLTAMWTYILKYHGTGTKAENEMRQIVADIGKYLLETGKSAIREDLSFVKKKAKTSKARSKKGKGYNRMLHTLDYARFNDCFDNMIFRLGIEQVLVNPAYTSKIAKQKYCGTRKIPVHNGAAYVIARRGQGFKDRYIPKKEKKKDTDNASEKETAKSSS